MAKSRSHRDEEDLKGRLREIEKENKALRKRLRKLERSRHIWQQYNLDADENHVPEEIKSEGPKCPSCEHGTLMLIDLGIKDLWSCSTCLYRKVALK